MNFLPFSGIRRMMEKATKMQQAGERVIHLEIGRPDFDTPERIKHAAAHLSVLNQIGYNPFCRIDRFGTDRKPVQSRNRILTTVFGKALRRFKRFSLRFGVGNAPQRHFDFLFGTGNSDDVYFADV